MKVELPKDYAERVYAGWLGKCIGVRLGAPVEGWTAEDIRLNLGEVMDFLPLPPGKLFKPDDDTAVPMVLIHALEDYGPGVTAADMGETYLNYVADQRGTFWWGGYGISCEHTAYQNMLNGIPSPLSGSIALNGIVLAEQIGGQIFSDIWGLVAPNQPELAADYAAKAASISHDGDGIRGGRFVAGLVSLAFSESDPLRLIEKGLALIEPDSEYTRVVRAVMDFHARHPQDWRICYDYLHKNFGYDRYPGAVHIIPNTGIVIMALLYGAGDFSRTVQIATMGGWDTDCNAGNVGAIMGVAVGLQGIDMRWRTQLGDILVNASLTGARNLIDIPTCCDLFVRLGTELAGGSVEPKARLHFDFPDSTQGMQSRTRGAEIVGLLQRDGALVANVRRLTKKGEVEVYVKTSCRPFDLSANYYGASFSPKIYPGQRITARVRVPANSSDMLLAAPFVWDDNHKARHQGQAVRLQPGAWTSIDYAIPPMHNVLFSEVGIVLHNLGEAWTGTLEIDDIDWEGPAAFTNDFAKERREFDAISQWTFLRGNWRMEEGALHGNAASNGELYTGAPEWTDYAFTVRLTPIVGVDHRVNVRVQGARRSYAVGLAADGRLVLYKNDKGYRELASIPFAWETGAEYAITLKAQGNTLTAAVGGEDVGLRFVDEDAPYLTGQVGLSIGTGCHVLYHSVEVAPL